MVVGVRAARLRVPCSGLSLIYINHFTAGMRDSATRSTWGGVTWVAGCKVIIKPNKWGDEFKPLAVPPNEAAQSNMIYQPREVFMVTTNIAARRVNAKR